MYEDSSHTDHAIKQLQSVVQEAVAGDVAAVAAEGTLTITDLQNAGDGETVTIGTTVYTFQTTLTDSPYNVLIGADDEGSCANLAAAINAGAGAGTNYGTNTPAHPDVTAVQATRTVVVTAKVKGVVGNAIASTETLAQGAWDAATLGTTTAGDGDVAVANITTRSALESVTMFAAGVPSDVTAEASINVDGAIILSTTDATGNTLLVRWMPEAVKLV